MADGTSTLEELNDKVKHLQLELKLHQTNSDDRLERIDRTLKALLTGNDAELDELRRKV